MTSQRNIIWPAGAILALVGLFLVLVRSGSAEVRLVASDLGLALGAFVGFIACALRARVESGRDRRGWILLAAALLSWTVGEGLWSYYELARNIEVPFPSWADVGYLGAIPLSAGALLSFSSAPSRMSTRFRALLDGLIVTGALLSLGWVAVAGPLYRSTSGSFLEQAIGLAYPLGDIVLISLVILVGARASWSARVPLAVIGGGLLALAISDIGYAYLTLIEAYASGNPIDAGWLVGYLLIALGALQVGDRYAARVKEERATRAQALLPYAGISLIVAASAIAWLQKGNLDNLLFWNLIVVVGLVSVRQLLLSLDNVALTENLEAKVRGRTAELESALQRLKEAQRLQEEFISNTSHELRTPLTTIIGTTHTLLKPRFGLDESGVEMAQMSLKAARRMARLVEDLLVASGISEKMPVDRRPIDVSRVARETVDEFESERTIEVEVPDSLMALGDEERLKVILGQLLSNADKFAPEGTRLRLKAAPAEVGLELLVIDEGPGIPQARWEEIFKRFVQLEGGSTRRHGGVGLGLFIARTLAESMGGDLRVEKSSEAGTTFRLTLDVAETVARTFRASGDTAEAGQASPR